MPSRDFTNEDLFSSRMTSTHSPTHSSQMKTVGPAISLRTSCWLLPQNEQWGEFFVSLSPPLLILEPGRDESRHSPHGARRNQARLPVHSLRDGRLSWG